MTDIPVLLDVLIGEEEYEVREQLLDSEWVEEETGLEYE